jgi:hypothetical protein
MFARCSRGAAALAAASPSEPAAACAQQCGGGEGAAARGGRCHGRARVRRARAPSAPLPTGSSATARWRPPAVRGPRLHTHARWLDAAARRACAARSAARGRARRVPAAVSALANHGRCHGQLLGGTPACMRCGQWWAGGGKGAHWPAGLVRKRQHLRRVLRSGGGHPRRRRGLGDSLLCSRGRGRVRDQGAPSGSRCPQRRTTRAQAEYRSTATAVVVGVFCWFVLQKELPADQEFIVRRIHSSGSCMSRAVLAGCLLPAAGRCVRVLLQHRHAALLFVPLAAAGRVSAQPGCSLHPRARPTRTAACSDAVSSLDSFEKVLADPGVPARRALA